MPHLFLETIDDLGLVGDVLIAEGVDVGLTGFLVRAAAPVLRDRDTREAADQNDRQND
jgi:hypothetical protein